MASSGTSPDGGPTTRLGLLLTGSEARELADHLADGDTLTAALRVIAPGRRPEVRAALEAVTRSGLPGTAVLIAVLRAIEGARSAPTAVDPLWTMPGHLAGAGRLTSSVPYLIEHARQSVTCSTFNFQRTSGLWDALRDAARRPGLTVRVYLDTAAADVRPVPGSPTTGEVAAHLRPATVLRTRRLDNRLVRNHAKFLAIDHRFLLVTSANFSWSAENDNVEFGVLLDNPNLAETVERELRRNEDLLFERVARLQHDRHLSIELFLLGPGSRSRRPEEALQLAKGMRLSTDIPPSWRTWLLLDAARAYADIGDAESAVRTLETLRKVAPAWMRQHTLAVAIVTGLWAGPRRPPGLRKLAEYLGVAA